MASGKPKHVAAVPLYCLYNKVVLDCITTALLITRLKLIYSRVTELSRYSQRDTLTQVKLKPGKMLLKCDSKT